MKVLFLPDYSEANAYQRALGDGLGQLGVQVKADPTRARRILPVSEAMRRHGRPDIIHVHWTEPYIASGSDVSRIKAQRMLLELRIAHAAGIRIVWTAHDLFRHDRSEDPAERAFMRSLFSIADAVIVHCEAAVPALVEALSVSASEQAKVHVIPHGHYAGTYPDEITRPAARARLGLSETDRVFAFVGWVRPYKGVQELLKAFSGLEADTARLIVAGRALDADYALQIERLAAADDRVQAHLEFVPDEDLQVYLRAADAVAAPFLEIFTSGSVLLAMSF